MARRHPEPVGAVEVPTYRDLAPVMGVGSVADYYGVSKQLAAKWARESRDWPDPFAVLSTRGAGTLWRTVDVIEWGKRHERKRAEGPRDAGDPRPPSQRRRSRSESRA